MLPRRHLIPTSPVSLSLWPPLDGLRSLPRGSFGRAIVPPCPHPRHWSLGECTSYGSSCGRQRTCLLQGIVSGLRSPVATSRASTATPIPVGALQQRGPLILSRPVNGSIMTPHIPPICCPHP